LNILVLGGSGNISYQFVSNGLKNNFNITTITRHSNKIEKRYCENIINYYFDVNEGDLLSNFLIGKNFDCVVDFICYNSESALKRINLFTGIIHKYFFISTTAMYSRNEKFLPYTESCPRDNLNWDYSRNKYEAENIFTYYYEKYSFPVTILRLGHTYDTALPISVGPNNWTTPKRIINDKFISVHDNGNSTWSLLHSSDASNAIVKLIQSKVGCDIFNVVSNISTNWNEITKYYFSILEKPLKINYVPSKLINEITPYFGNGIIYHKMWSESYDNKKLTYLIPDWQENTSLVKGISSSLAWYQNNIKRLETNPEHDSLLDKLSLL